MRNHSLKSLEAEVKAPFLRITCALSLLKQKDHLLRYLISCCILQTGIPHKIMSDMLQYEIYLIYMLSTTLPNKSGPRTNRNNFTKLHFKNSSA